MKKSSMSNSALGALTQGANAPHSEESKPKPASVPSAEWVQTSPLFNNERKGDDFSGVARSVECYDYNGHKNFRILTMFIEKGHIKRIEVSDPFAHFELISKLEIATEFSQLNLNNNWAEGKTWVK